jgi:hypothetical protein
VKINLREQVCGWQALICEQILRSRLRCRIALGLIVAASLNCCAALPARSEESIPAIRVRVFNYTAATPSTVVAAERGAEQILRDTGVRMIWLDCRVGVSSDNPSDPCRQPLAPNEVLLRVLSDRKRNGIPDDAFGFAVPPILASVYYEHVRFLAARTGSSVASILACVMVHELGHLLLGSGSHSEIGVMKGKWGSNEMRQIAWGGFHFTPQQSRLIRGEAQVRMLRESAQIIVEAQQQTLRFLGD